MDPISASFLFVFIAPLLLFWSTQNIHYLALWISIFLFGGCIETIKMLLGTEGKFARPKEASQCDLLCISEDDEGKPGYPSGHVAISTFFVGCTLGILLFQHTISRSGYIIGILFGCIWIYAIARSRIYKKCHTEEQVVAGFIAGLIGVFSYFGILNILQLI